MAKLLAALTLFVFVLPAIIVSLWWAALCTRLLHRVPAGDQWETQLSSRRALRLLVVTLLLAGWIVIFWSWIQFANSQLDPLGLRPIADWVATTLRS
ncbi:MAG: hypothetical protein RMM58_09080 [Chloroflexota bacterium]|nr:hypothetical protein [Dehalococcoidia bacterium]MDW8254019.1 hypothetical protein [Chloroflexota bacterium]